MCLRHQLPLGNVRTDPLLHPTCLTDHVHTFYGVNASLRPETTYSDMRNAKGNSGNVEENKSLYWHPAVYMVSNGRYTLAPVWFGSAYYVWQTGQPTAFPNGFNMIARGSNEKARMMFTCEAPYPCEREDCSTSGSSNFPSNACAVLEVSLVFPSCWDGVNTQSADMMSHVSYDIEADSLGSFDGPCPSSHPVKIPEVHFYFRIKPYEGGTYVFSDATDIMHSDYFSGWDQGELQTVLDECSNDSDAAMPDAWCETHLTFRDAPKAQKEDDDIAAGLRPFQPPVLDLQRTVSPEAVTDVAALPRGACTGTLLPASGGPSPPSPSPPPSPPPPLPPRDTTTIGAPLEGAPTCQSDSTSFTCSLAMAVYEYSGPNGLVQNTRT